MYKFAAQTKLRFPSTKGDLCVEHLFELPLKAASGFDLDTVARTIHSELEGLGEVSFVEDNTNNPRKKALETSLEIVKDVIATKVAENAARTNKAQKAALRLKLNDAIAAKKDEALSQASIEDLQKQLAALDD